MPGVEHFVQGVSAFDGLKESVGLALAVSFVFNIVMIWLFISERSDRRKAWSAYNALLKDNIHVLKALETSVAILITMQRGPSRRRAPLPEKEGVTHE